MAKKFNITGTCNPLRHYMVDTASRFNQIKALIDAGDYFTINRGRQFGKTTTLNLIWRRLSDQYVILSTSFEGIGDSAFDNEQSFTKVFCRLMQTCLEYSDQPEEYLSFWEKATPSTMQGLGKVISKFCQNSQKPVILLIDEVDKSSNNQLFLSFIGMLRELYLEQNKIGVQLSFHSVVLAGVYDIKNLKLKIRPEEERKYNSPWNIATEFTVDMAFASEEIAQMLKDYENDHHTGMDIKAVSEAIHKFTSGYPFLVSKLCKVIDEELNQDWTEQGVLNAVKQTVDQKNTLFDSLTKAMENDKAFKDFIYSVSMLDAKITYTFSNPLIEMGNMFSFIKRGPDNNVMMHNLIFEEVVHNHFVAEELIAAQMKYLPYNEKAQYVTNGKLDMKTVVTRFAEFLREEFRKEDIDFLERQGRLLFLSFLKPIINGTGNYYVEPQTRGNRRMDLIVNYNNEEFVVELKIWRGEKYEENGKNQLTDYLAIRGLEEGYLVSFDFSKKKRVLQQSKPHWIECQGKRIFEVVV